MKYLILSISVLCLGVSGITGKSLSKVQSKKPLETVYKIKEDKDGSTLTISRPQMEKPTLREITYYHIIERPYKKKGANNEPSNEDQPTYEEIRRVFTNGPGFQYVRVKQTDPSNDDNKINKDSVNDGTNQIDIRHGDLEASNPGQDNIEFPKEITNDKDTVEPKRRKRDIRYETSVAKREKRENNILRFPDLPSTLYMNKQPAFTNVPNSIGGMALTPNKDENPSIRMNGIMPGPMPYGMGFTGNNGNFWNNFNDPYHVFHYDDNQGFNPESHRTEEPTRFQPTPNTINSLPNTSDLGTKEINGSPDKNTNPIGSKDHDERKYSIYQGHGKEDIQTNKINKGSHKRGENLVGSKDRDHREGSKYQGYSKESGSGESDSRESRYESDESRESGSRSGEDSRGSGESHSGSDENSGEDSAEHGYGEDSRESGERDFLKHNDDSVKGSKDPNKVKSESYTDNSKETKKKFDQILSDLHNIFVKSNATVVIPGNNNLVGSKDAVNDGVKDDTKKSNMISVLEGLFTNLIRNTIIVNNNVPVVQTPGFNTQTDASNPDIPQKYHDNVETTTNSDGIKTVTDLNSFKDTTDKPINKTGDLKPDEIKPELNGTDSKNFGRPDEVTTFNVTRLPNDTDTELNNNKTLPEKENNDKRTSSTEKPNEDKDKINKGDNIDDDKKTNKTDEKKNNNESDDSNKHGNATETPVTGLKDNDCPSNNKDNKDTGRNNTKIDQMVDLMNNEKFWKFMGDLSTKYLESLVERTTKFMKEEIAAQIDKYFKEHKPEDNKDIIPKKDEVSNEKSEKKDKNVDNVIENTNEGNTTENPIAKTNKDIKENSKKDKQTKKDSENFDNDETKKDNTKGTRKKDIINVKSHTIYGNTVGNDKVTNIYVFYASKNIDAIMKNIKDLVNGNNSTNIFNFEPSYKHHKAKDEDKHSNGKHKGKDVTDIPTDTVTDKNGDTVTEPNTGDKVTVPTKEPSNDIVTESNIEQPVTNSNKSNDTTESSTNSTPKEVTTETAHSSSTDISINSNKEEVSTESSNNKTDTDSNVTDKASNDVTTEAATTEKNSNDDIKNVTSKVEDKMTDGNATTISNIDVTTEPSKDNEKTNGTTVSSNTDVSTENPSNETTTEIPNNGTSTDKIETSTTQIDVSTIKPNVTENKAENATTHGNVTSNHVTTSNVTDASGPTTEGNKVIAGNSTENPSTESPNSNNKNVTDVKEKPETGNDTQITPEKDISLNKTSDNNEINSHNNKSTESPTANNSTEKNAEKNTTTTDLKISNNTDSIEKPETLNKNVTLENNNDSEKKNGTATSTEKNPDKSTDKQKDENSKMKSEDNKDSEENKDKKENQTSTESSLNKDTSTKKTDEATTVKIVK